MKKYIRLALMRETAVNDDSDLSRASSYVPWAHAARHVAMPACICEYLSRTLLSKNSSSAVGVHGSIRDDHL